MNAAIVSCRASVHAELVKLRTRGNLILVGAMTVFSLLSVERIVHSVGSTGGVQPGTRAAIEQILGVGMAPGLLVVLLGVLSVTGELRHGSITPTLLVTPDRRRVLIAKVLACSLIGAVITLVLAGLAIAAGAVGGVLAGVPVGHAIRLVAGFVALTSFWGWFGVGIGALVRQQVPALVIPIAWLLVVETLLRAFDLGAVRWWLPGGAGDGLTGSPTPGVLPAWLAALVLAGYALALSIPGAWCLVRSDIT